MALSNVRLFNAYKAVTNNKKSDAEIDRHYAALRLAKVIRERQRKAALPRITVLDQKHDLPF